MAVRRAYGAEAKDSRRKAILDAADSLFSASQILPTAARVAKAAGLAKGTLYLYFESREAMFAALLLDRWCRALQDLEAKLEAEGDRAGAIATVLDSFVVLIETRPILMLLDAMLPEFRRGMSEKAREDFNTTLTERMVRTGAAVERALELAPGRGFQLLVRSQAFARGLWQTCDVTDATLQQAVAASSFAEELRASLKDYWRGALE